MKMITLVETDLNEIVGGDFAYDVGRVVRFALISGGGFFTGSALADWAGTQAINDAKASK